MPATPPANKGKSVERPLPQNMPPAPLALPTLLQLKFAIENAPGVVKNAADAHNYLEQKQWSLPQHKITCSQMATILLTLVSTQGPRKTTDKLPEAIANTIKAVAYLLEEAIVTQYADQIMAQISSAPPNADK
jgi:hypothetical protein